LVPQRHFQLHDRVRLIRQIDFYARGRLGTIQRVFGVGELYDVLFDGKATPRIVHGDNLELVDPSQPKDDASGK
jgi:hypothetical protein